MMNESEMIEDAFKATVKRLYDVFFQAYTDALGDQAREQEAEQAFRRAVLHARHVRDRALVLLP